MAKVVSDITLPKAAQHSSPPLSFTRDKPGQAVLSPDNPAVVGPKPSKSNGLAGTCQPDTSEFMNCRWCWPVSFIFPFPSASPAKQVKHALPRCLGDHREEGIKFSSFTSSVSPHQQTTPLPNASVLCVTSYFTRYNTVQ